MSTSIWDKWKEKMQTASSAMSRLVSAKPKTLTTKDTDATTAATAVDSQNLQTTPAAQNTTTQTTNTQNNAGDDRFLQWYKQQFGKDYTEGSFNKTDGISDKDYEIGNNLYQAYLQKQNLQKQHDSAIQAVDQSTAKQRQEASILRDKMAKYLNLQNKNSGLNNLGVSESVGLQADSQYLTNLGTIESNANTEKTNLQNNLQNNQTSIDTNTASNEQSILDKYQQLAREDEQKEYDRQQDEYNKQKYEEEQAKAQQQTNFNEFMAVVESGSFNTAAELESFYAKYKDKLSPEQQATAEQYINFYKNNPDQQEIDKEVDKNKPQVKENPDGTKTEITDNGDGTTTEKTIDQNGNVVGEKTGLKIDTSSGHSRYTTSDGSTISSPSGGAKFKITYGSNNNDHANNYDITYNGNKYKVEVGKEFAGSNAQLQEIYSYMKQINGRDTIEEGDYVLYNGELYIASNTGRLWTVQDRSKFWAWNWGGKTASDLRAEMQRDFG